MLSISKMQYRVPYLSVSPQCCIIRKAAQDTQSHLLINCHYAISFWKELIDASKWHLSLLISTVFLVTRLMATLTLKGKESFG